MTNTDLPHVIFNDFVLPAAGRRRRLRLSGYRYVEIWVRTTAKTGTNPTLDIAVQRKFPGKGADFVSIANKNVTQLVSGTALPDVQVITLTEADLVNVDTYLLFTVGGTLSPSWTLSVSIIGKG